MIFVQLALGHTLQRPAEGDVLAAHAVIEAFAELGFIVDGE
jgi:hypothetical protein